ncbi:hypothetical protein FVEG_10055 [Fusarium verticillioides 7600]|uniref:Uncharacterized protein n=1 Tax=Gibberella moniliformis (strain M3125 / FGSC 7600) TaxID=334819 RepID=W7N2N2_GIBM7|nr:hypothetical protein FVEG_10055 [Fusarium verticillioides 7600]EWG50937.1 hypothetical protein FVEG_10055 [Fusarium verticillioides 7600]
MDGLISPRDITVGKCQSSDFMHEGGFLPRRSHSPDGNPRDKDLIAQTKLLKDMEDVSSLRGIDRDWPQCIRKHRGANLVDVELVTTFFSVTVWLSSDSRGNNGIVSIVARRLIRTFTLQISTLAHRQ